MLEVRKADLSGAFITFGEEELIKDYFLDEKTFISRHNVGRYTEEDEIFMQLGCVRIRINAHTAYHLYQLFSELNQEYQLAQARIEATLGTTGFTKNGRLYLIDTITRLQWDEMLYFARAHDWYSDEQDFEWNIFNNNCSNEQLTLSPHKKDERIAEIFAQLVVKESETQMNMLDLFWGPGYCWDRNSMEGFDNAIKWKADYTLNWVRECFLPKAYEFYCIRNGPNRFLHKLLDCMKKKN